MKKVIFTLLIQVLVTISIANAQGSVFNLNTYSNSLFTVQIDNHYTTAPDRNFTFQNLAPGNHHVRIFKLRGRHHAKEVYSGFVSIPFNSAVNAVYERYGQLRIVNILALAPACIDPYEVDHCNTTVVYQNQPQAVCDAEFNQILGTLNNINFDSSRLNVAKQIISDKYLTTTQVIQIMNLFSFDSSRLEFAKCAYSRTLDRNRYFQTFNSFTFDSSVNELSNFIARS